MRRTMRILTRKTATRGYVEMQKRLFKIYPGTSPDRAASDQKRLDLLATFGDDPDPDRVSEKCHVLDDTFPPKCDECECTVGEVVMFREHNARSTFICLKCLREAIEQLAPVVAEADLAEENRRTLRSAMMHEQVRLKKQREKRRAKQHAS